MTDSSEQLDGRDRAEKAAYRALALSNCGEWHSYHHPDCGRCSLKSASQIAIDAALADGGVIDVKRLHYWVNYAASLEAENDRLTADNRRLRDALGRISRAEWNLAGGPTFAAQRALDTEPCVDRAWCQEHHFGICYQTEVEDGR